MAITQSKTKRLAKSKTIQTGVAAVLSGLVGYYTGTMGAPDAIQLAAIGLTAIFQRVAINKSATGDL